MRHYNTIYGTDLLTGHMNKFNMSHNQQTVHKKEYVITWSAAAVYGGQLSRYDILWMWQFIRYDVIAVNCDRRSITLIINNRWRSVIVQIWSQGWQVVAETVTEMTSDYRGVSEIVSSNEFKWILYTWSNVINLHYVTLHQSKLYMLYYTKTNWMCHITPKQTVYVTLHQNKLYMLHYTKINCIYYITPK